MSPTYRQPLAFGDSWPPVVKGLLLVNVAVFALQLFIERMARTPSMEWQFALVPALVTLQGRVWQLFTYQFLHASPMHLLFNMLGLFFFGRIMEWHWGSRRFLVIYLICGVVGGIATWLAGMRSPVPTVGASGAILGVIVAFGLTFPDEIVFFNLFIPMKAKWLVAIYAVLNILGGERGVSYTTHLGGMFAGLIAWRWEEPRASRGRFHPAWKDRVRQWWQHRDRRRNEVRAKRVVRDREQIDAILEKINREGMESLTDKERRILDEASRKGE